ncbi:MAG TPA: protein kinase, partial [Polyangiales bacterium]|nr:protein kinase [Polyangiales bacterium]
RQHGAMHRAGAGGLSVSGPMNQVGDRESDPLIGGHIEGRYTLLGIIGRGGMGVVYEGIHDELGRHVAIKVLNAAWAADRVAVERFLREARTASSFSHGNIVDVSDLGRLPDGRPYLVMPKIDGTDLATMLYDVGPQPAKRVAELLRGVASALDLIHAKGYVHRDIKPENLMYVAREDGSETVILLDFGIAALMMSNDRRLTSQGQVFGTPHYMAPEAATGDVTDARGDVYALATVAFELICGTLPFTTDNPMQLLSMKLVNDPPSMTEVTGMSFPVALEEVMARGLARDIDARYPTATELIAAIRDATEDAPVSWQTGVLRPSMHSGAHRRGSWRDEVSRSFDVGAGSQPSHSSQPAAPYSSQRPSPRPSNRASPYPSQRPSPYSSHPPRRTPSAPSPNAAYYDSNTDDLLGAGLRESERSGRYRPPRTRTRWFALLALGVIAGGIAYAIRSLDDAPPDPEPAPAIVQKKPVAPPPVASAPSLPTPTTSPLQAANAASPSETAKAAPPIAAAEPIAAPTIEPSKPSEPVADSPKTLQRKAKSSHSKTTAHHPIVEAPPPPPPAPTSEPMVVTKDEEEPAPAPEPSGPDPNQIAQYTQSATTALLHGEVSRAVDLLRQATRLDPDRALSWRSLGLALERAGDSHGAIDAYHRYLSLVPTGQQADLVRARVRALGEE